MPALYRLAELGTVVIHSCRVAPFEFHEPGREIVWRDEGATAQEILAIRDILDSVGLGQIEVWTRPYKPPALVYIDDRGYRFDGDWGKAVEFVEGLAELGLTQGIGGNQ